MAETIMHTQNTNPVVAGNVNNNTNRGLSEGDEQGEGDKFLVYRLGAELYASSLLSVREVLKIPKIRFIHQMPSHFSGVINLRGKIISVLDLRVSFNISIKADQEDARILIIDLGERVIGGVVDQVVAVEIYQENMIEYNRQIKLTIESEFFTGIAKNKNGLVHLVDIGQYLRSINN